MISSRGALATFILPWCPLAVMLLAAGPVTYLGRQVTVIDPGIQDPDGYYPKGEAKVCVLGEDEKGCYTAPKGFGRMPSLSTVELRKGEWALFFEAASGGVSGWGLHFALLEFCDRDHSPGCRIGELQDFLPYELEVSNQSRHAFWTLPEISDSRIFLTADFVWGPRESHYTDHRYIVSIYVRRPDDFDALSYYLVDQYMTVRSYGYKADDLDDVLGAEKREILSRLQRVRASWPKATKRIEPKQ